MDSTLKLLKTVIHNQITKSNTARVKEFRSFGKGLVQVGFAAREEKPIFVKIGMCFDELSNLWEAQSSKDWEPFHRVLYEYKVLVSNWNNCLEIFKEVESRAEEKEQSRLSVYKAALASEKKYFKQ